jgi:hypothetical protein
VLAANPLLQPQMAGSPSLHPATQESFLFLGAHLRAQRLFGTSGLKEISARVYTSTVRAWVMTLRSGTESGLGLSMRLLFAGISALGPNNSFKPKPLRGSA